MNIVKSIYHLVRCMTICIFWIKCSSNEHLNTSDIQFHAGKGDNLAPFMNLPLQRQNPLAFHPLSTDAGQVVNFKYPFAFSHTAYYSGGWVRQVNVQDFPLATQMSGVQMKIYAGAVREMHWHPQSEWAYVLEGTCRVTLIDPEGRSFVGDIGAGDLWLFPTGNPHSIQGLAPDGCFFLMVFNSGSFSDFDTLLLTQWMDHVPLDVLALNFQVPKSTFRNLPKQELYLFASELPRPLAVEKAQAAEVTGEVPNSVAFYASKMTPNYTRLGGSAKIIDKRNYPITDIAGTIITLKPGALRELHWHPNADEWNYCVTGHIRLGVFNAGGNAMTMDTYAGDIGYVPQAQPHWFQNIGKVDAVMLEVFPTPYFEDVSLAEWLAHTPTRLVEEHFHPGEKFLNGIAKTLAVIRPWNRTNNRDDSEFSTESSSQTSLN